jgi:DNA-binding NarL/FixJ family response regulator
MSRQVNIVVHKHTLTGREVDVLRLLASGLRDKEIAKELGLSTRTVQHYVSNILSKLSASTRTEAVQNALAASVITFDVEKGVFREPGPAAIVERP